MTNPSVSVVVPVRNAEPYLDRCLESLAGQTEPNLEVLVIDDGSDDGTGEVAERFRARFPGIFRVFRQSHSGQGAARNLGIRMARGRFVGMVDGDDWVDVEMFAALRRRAEATSAEIVVGNGTMVEQVSGTARPFPDRELWETLRRRNPELLFDPRAEPDLFLLDASACRRLCSRALLLELAEVHPEGVLFDDVAAHFRLLLAARKVALVDRNLYRYRIGHPGRVTDRTDASLLDIFFVFRLVLRELELGGPGVEVGVRFLRFQTWVLLWLGSQIRPDLVSEFALKAAELARAFSLSLAESLARLAERDADCHQSVLLQMRAADGEYSRLLRGELSVTNEAGSP